MASSFHGRVEEDDEDLVEKKLKETGCMEAHYAVQDCMFEHRDWRKCQDHLKKFRECMEKYEQRKKL